MFRKLRGPPYEGNLSLGDAIEGYQGDLSSEEVRELLKGLCASGTFLGKERRVLLLATNLDPSCAGLVPFDSEALDGALEGLRRIEGLKLEWEGALGDGSKSWLLRGLGRLASRLGIHRVGGYQGAIFSVESAEALGSSRLEFQLFYEVEICSLRSAVIAPDLIELIRSDERIDLAKLLERDESYAFLSAWFDDRTSQYAAHERARPELWMTTHFACGPSCPASIREAVASFSSAHT